MIWALSGALAVFIIWLAFRKVQKLGAEKQKAKSLELVVDNVEKAKQAARSARDPDRRKRLRDKYTRE